MAFESFPSSFRFVNRSALKQFEDAAPSRPDPQPPQHHDIRGRSMDRNENGGNGGGNYRHNQPPAPPPSVAPPLSGPPPMGPRPPMQVTTSLDSFLPIKADIADRKKAVDI